jgi:structural maintenance of chromosome 4
LNDAYSFRATFIALDKIQKYQSGANSTIQTPEHSERLFDLIKVHNPEVKVAFYFALTDTLVTDTLERATKYLFLPSYVI